jgi:hypothetical protein
MKIALMMEAARTSETLVNFYQTTRCYNPEDSHLHTHRRQNLKSYLVNLYGEATHRYVRRFVVNFYQTTRCYNPEDSNLHRLNYSFV